MTSLIFYLNAGPNKRLGPTVFAAILTAVILWVPYLTRPYFYFFRELPNLQEPTTKNYSDRFAYYFVVAGLMEELIKATPALILLAMTPILGLGRNRFLGRLGIHAPIDGVLMGIASGGAFTLIETLEQYVPRIMSDIATQLSKITVSPEQTDLFHQMAELSTFSLGFLLLMPRILGALIGHMSYALVFGYFIGLAAFHRSRVLVLLAVGWLTAAAMHGIWDASGNIDQTLYIGVASFLVSFAYFIKARAMSEGLA
jgi:RsiW-degrading membrane proteinase PrsW (M82 family)